MREEGTGDTLRRILERSGNACAPIRRAPGWLSVEGRGPLSLDRRDDISPEDADRPLLNPGNT